MRAIIRLTAIIATLIFTVTIAPSQSPTAETRLAKARALIGEKSYRVAQQEYTALKTQSTELTPAQARETTVGLALVEFRQGVRDRVYETLDEVAKEHQGASKGEAAPRWSAMAAMVLAAVHQESFIYQPDGFSTYSVLLKQATTALVEDAGLPEEMVADARELLLSKFDGWIMPQVRDATSDFLAQVMAQTKDRNTVAALQLRRVKIQRDKCLESGDASKCFASLEEFAKEFADTPSAPAALLMVLQNEFNNQKYQRALTVGESLLSSFPKAQETAETKRLLDLIRRKELQLAVPRAYAPGEPISLVITSRNLAKAELVIEKFDPAQALRTVKKPEAPEFLASQGTVVSRQALTFEKRDDYLATTSPLEVRVPGVGAYVLRFVGPDENVQQLLLVSDLILVESDKPQGRHQFWAVDARTGAPRADTTILYASQFQNAPRMFSNKYDPEFKKFEDASVDSRGLAEFQRPADDNRFAAVARSGEHWAIIASGYRYNLGQTQSESRVYVFTDRPVSRPEQTIHWKAIVRINNAGKLEQPEKIQRFQMEMRDPQGNVVSSRNDISLDDFGTASGSYDIPKGAPLGVYSINVRRTPGADVNGNATFRIEEYKKPEYEVNVAAAASVVKINEKVKADVTARYYFGAPVANAEVNYTVRRKPRPWWFWSNDDCGGLCGLSWFQNNDEQPRQHMDTSGAIVATGKGLTDANGKFQFEFKADEDPADRQRNQSQGGYRRGMWWWEPAPLSYNFEIQATVVDKSRRNIDGIGSIVVSEQALKLGVSTPSGIYTAKDLVRLSLSSKNMSGTPTATTGTLYIERVVWNEAKSKEDVTTVSTQKVNITSSGTLDAEWRVPSGGDGQYRALFLADDPFGGRVAGRTMFTVANENTTDIFTRYNGIQILAGNKDRRVGDTAKILVLAEKPGTNVWLRIMTTDQLIEGRVVRLTNRTNFFEFPVTDAWVPNVKISVLGIHDRAVVAESADIVVPPTRQILNMTLEHYNTPATPRPGTKGNLRVRVTDHAGNPVRAQFSLAMFDVAVTYIAADTRSDIRSIFYGSRRPLDVRWSSSLPQNLGNDGTLLYSMEEHQVHALGFAAQSRFRYDPRRGTVSKGDVYRTNQGGRSERRALAAAAPTAAGSVVSELPDMVVGDAESNNAMDNNFFVSRDSFDLSSIAAGAAPAALRQDFRDSMFWSPSVVTDEQGAAIVDVTYPDSLTSWKTVAVGIDEGNRVGEVFTHITVKKDLQVRVETPRFFRERDIATLSAILRNDRSTTATVLARLGIGNNLTLLTGQTTETARELGPGTETRVDWRVLATEDGSAKIRVDALSRDESDAVEVTRPVLPYGIDTFVAWNGSSTNDSTSSASITRAGDRTTIAQAIRVPRERIVATSRLTIHVSPSLAFALRDALPYLVEYPYGCVEQTMSRFMPSVIVANAFAKLNLPENPAMSAKLSDVTDAGLRRLYDFQHSDGAWGWWKDDARNAYMTGYVMYGFTLARQADLSVDEAKFQQGLSAIRRMVAEFQLEAKPDWRMFDYGRTSQLHTLAWHALVLTLNNDQATSAADILFKNREYLTPQGLAILARVLHRIPGREADGQIVLRNLANFVVEVPENNTCHWGKTQHAWYWWDEGVESTALAVQAFLEVDPQSPYLPQAVKWLVLNRQGRQWKSTKDTAHAILALTAWMTHTRESATNLSIKVTAGAETRTLSVMPQNFWNFDGSVVLEGDAVPEGDTTVTLEATGNGTLFYSIYAEYFTREEQIPEVGNEILVSRRYERIIRKPSTTTGTAAVEEFVPLRDGERVRSGDELRVVMTIKSLNNYEYLVFEDAKPAGAEPVELRSGSTYAGTLCSNMELRDQMVSFFITYLPQGEHRIEYRCRAEIPGTFQTMPTRGYAMYFPALRANSRNHVLNIDERPEPQR